MLPKLRAAGLIVALLFGAPVGAQEPEQPAAEAAKPEAASPETGKPETGKTPAASEDTRKSICLLLEVGGAGQRPAGRVLCPRDLAGKPLPSRRGRAHHAQRPARAGHRPVHAGHGGGAKPAQPARPDPGAAEVGGIPARAAPRVRQSRAAGGGLQRRAAPRARMAGRHRRDAGGDPQLCAGDHRRVGRAMGQSRRRRRPQAAVGPGVRRVDGAAQARAQRVRRGARAAHRRRHDAAVGRDPRRRHVARSACSRNMPRSSSAMPRCWPGATRSCWNAAAVRCRAIRCRIGAETRAAANELCNRIHKSGGDCVVLRNPRG